MMMWVLGILAIPVAYWVIIAALHWRIWLVDDQPHKEARGGNIRV